MSLDPYVSLSYRALRASGASRRSIEAALELGMLRRARRDVYVSGEASDRVFAAARVGGRLDCVSLMQELGVFVLAADALHVQIERGRNRLRSPHARHIRLQRRQHRVVTHWRVEHVPADALLADIEQALAHAVTCQQPRAAIATLDSALNRGVIRESQLDAVFAAVPLRLHRLRAHLDGRAEAGAETFARLIARTLGVEVRSQVWIEGVGRVDLLVAGWIIVECDSREHHGGWEAQERDRRRDLAAARQGFVCIRPTARHMFDEPTLLLEALRGLIERGRPA